MANFMDVKRPQPWINLFWAVLLLISPFVAGYVADQIPTWHACVVAAAIAVLALASVATYFEWEDWLTLVIGIWTAVAPWGLGFANNANAMLSHVVLGVLVALTTAWELWQVRNGRPRVAA
jgi:hypothetical protein